MAKKYGSTPQEIEVSSLLLDDHNFRLNEKEAKGASQETLLKILERDFELSTIAESLIDNGYFLEEPLSGIPEPKGSGKYIVVEGNRRLATLKFLVQPDYRKVSFQGEYWDAAAERLKYDLSRVPVILYKDREELTNFLGFRHIAGIIRWDPLMKARFIHHLVERRGKTANFSDIARETGSKTSTIRDNYIAYRILCQARDKYEIDTSNLEEHFSVFYRAISDRAIIDFIGLNKNLPISQLKNPIRESKASALKELIGFIHGTGTEEPVITDSRQITRLGEILDSREALLSLRRYRSLSQAIQLTGGEARRLIENLERAIYYMKNSLQDTFQYKNDMHVQETFLKLWSVAQELKKSFPDENEGQTR
jgi:hypothetical protein